MSLRTLQRVGIRGYLPCIFVNRASSPESSHLPPFVPVLLELLQCVRVCVCVCVCMCIHTECLTVCVCVCVCVCLCVCTCIYSFLKFFVFCLFRAAPVAHGGSQARGEVGAVATGLRHSHSNGGRKPHLRPIPQLMPMPDP